MLDRAAVDGKIGYHPSCKNLKLTHLCFADDIMVFSDGKIRSTKGITEVFQDFAKVSGLRISIEKSTIFMAGVPNSIRETILERFGFEIGTLPVRYLGLPLMTKRMAKTDYLPLIEKIRVRIQSWRNRFLSFAGRLQLLTSVISSLTNFWMSAFRLPSSCIKEIEKLCAAFLWAGSDLNPRKAKIAWTTVCSPKQEGGLGIKALEEMNKVSCFKLIWRIVSARNSLWVNWIQKQLIRTGSFWSVKGNTSSGSWMWRKLLKYRSQAMEFHKVEVKSGVQSSFWYDCWSGLGRIYEALGDRGFIDLGIRSEATVQDAIAGHRPRRHRLGLLNQIEHELNMVRERHSDASDISLWRSRDGKFKNKFSSKETWHQIRNTQLTREWFKGVWFSNATPKFSFMVWLATDNRLSTGDRMRYWNSGASSSCIFCQDPDESRNHLFFLCGFSSQIWEALSRNLLKSNYTLDYMELLSLISGPTYSCTTRFILRYVFQAAIHTIWKERNRRRHGEIPSSALQLISILDRLIRNRLTSLKALGSHKLEDGLRIWFSTRS